MPSQQSQRCDFCMQTSSAGEILASSEAHEDDDGHSAHVLSPRPYDRGKLVYSSGITTVIHEDNLSADKLARPVSSNNCTKCETDRVICEQVAYRIKLPTGRSPNADAVDEANSSSGCQLFHSVVEKSAYLNSRTPDDV